MRAIGWCLVVADITAAIVNFAFVAVTGSLLNLVVGIFALVIGFGVLFDLWVTQ